MVVLAGDDEASTTRGGSEGTGRIYKARVGLILFVGCVLVLLVYIPNIDRFNRRIWDSKDVALDARRIEMAEQLVDSGRLLNMTVESVRELLGPPPGLDTEELVPTSGIWVYPVGFIGWRIDPYCLIVEFDDRGVVTGADVKKQ